MQILHTANPTGHFSGLFVRLINGINIDWSCARNILALNVLQFQNSFILVVKAWLVKHRNAQVLLLPIRLGHLEEGVHLTDGRDVVWNEWFDLRVQVNLLWLIALDVLKHLLQLL